MAASALSVTRTKSCVTFTRNMGRLPRDSPRLPAHRCVMRFPLCLSFCVTTLAPVSSRTDLGPYIGNYEVGTREVIAIAEWEIDPHSPHVLAFTHFDTGRYGVLTEVGSDEFTLPTGVIAGPPEATIRFVRSGDRVTGFTFARGIDTPQSATRTTGKREDLTIDAGDAKLGATFFLPAGPGPFPAVVIVPAGALGRTAVATFPNFFVGEGFAVLAYDGRRATGAGAFDRYAADAIAAVEHLRRRHEIDGGHVGLWGHSQGGWLSLVAASKSSAIAFVIDHSGMLVPAWRQELYRIAAEAEADGVPPHEVSAAVEFEGRLMEVGRTGTGWEELAATMRANEKAPWLDLVYAPKSLDELQGVWRNDYSFDPRPFAARVRQPVLALFGGLDRSTPIESAGNLANAMRENERLSIEFFPTANHAFLESVTGGNREIATLSRFVPGMFASMRRWLRTNGRAH